MVSGVKQGDASHSQVVWNMQVYNIEQIEHAF